MRNRNGTRVARLGAWCAAHPGRTMLLWGLVLTCSVASAMTWGGQADDDVGAPGSGSERARAVLETRLPAFAGAEAAVVFHHADGLTAPDRMAVVSDVVAAIATQPSVATATDPFDPSRPALSADGRTALVSVQYEEDAAAIGYAAVERLDAAAEIARAEGVQVELGGSLVQATRPRARGAAESLGVLAAFVVLLLAFGSFRAALLPIAGALLGLGVGLSLISIASVHVSVPTVAPGIAAMIGLGVSVDYALLVLSRFRHEMAGSGDVQQAIGRSMGTAGRASFFAGVTVIVALAGLLTADLPLVTAIAGCVAVMVLAAVAISLTAIPALLAVFGSKISRRPADTGARWRRWVSGVARHPARSLALGTVALMVLAAPALSMQLGQLDGGVEPVGTTQRAAYDLISESFGPGVNGPFLLSVEAQPPGGTVAAASAQVQAIVAADPGIAAAVPVGLSADGSVAALVAIPDTPPRDVRTSETVARLRSALVAVPDAVVHLGGATATLSDVADRIGERLPWVVVAVLLSSFLLLTAVFRSPVVAVKAAALNVLAIAAAWGVIVAVFQWGWGLALTGLDETVPIVSFVPLLMFAFLFGLSMDYEVFILTRVREAWERSGDSVGSVVEGVTSTARVVTSAALIMIAVFTSSIVSEDPNAKMMGLGLAVAVALDATIVRVVLVPASMVLLGRANWWWPAGRSTERPSVVETPPALVRDVVEVTR